MDVRQIMGAFLTFSMFMMLGNMIKRDHFDGDVLLDVPMVANVEQDFVKMSKHSLLQLHNKASKTNGQRQKLCWDNSLLEKVKEPSRGFVTFSLTNGPEYHVSQIANAVLVAKHLGATLVLPEIIGNQGEKRSFEEIYDVEKFMTSMNGLIQVERRKNPESSRQKSITIKVPYNANRNYIKTNIKPLFQTTPNVRVITYFPSSNVREGKVDKDMSPYSCWAMFEALHLKPELQHVVDSIVSRLRGGEPKGEFMAIDFKSEKMGTSVCRGERNEGTKSCYNIVEITQFLRKIGYEKNTTIYVTQPRSGRELDALKDSYTNIFTKEEIMEEAEKQKFSSGLEREIIDFHLCSVSDVFVPAVSGLFYANVVGNRIATSNHEVLLPSQIESTMARDHMSSYISKRSHPAYACFCK
ncbi:unnamed protein product [Lactuca saligna]|uniref:O-fucosyltransferase family protein n=1 Tax=Lactuca saligna TaxID=75948 RepID=A0AA35Z509_LACSI|nr:unnamed protein product [Lactuca saligna]